MFGKKKDKADDGKAVEPAAEPKKAKAKAEKKAKVPKPSKAPKAAKEPKPAKAPKAPKPKKKPAVVTGKSGPNFLAAHVEKLVLGVAALAVVYFVYAGLTAEGYPTTKEPAGLKSDAASLMTQIKEDHWEQIVSERDIEPTTFQVDTEKMRQATDASLYSSRDLVWDPKAARVFEKRGDPALLPPEDLVVRNVIGALAIEVDKDIMDPMDELENAEPIEAPKRPRSRRGNRGGGAGYGGEGGAGGGYGGEMGGGLGGLGGPGGPAGGDGDAETPVRRLTDSYDLGIKLASSAGGMGGGMMGGGMMGSAGGGGGAGGSGRGLGDNKDSGPKTKVVSRGVMFNAITALVPHRKMAEEYDQQFENTGSFDPRRDIPVYLSFEVQRADVTQDPTRAIAENEWTDITDGGQQAQLYKKQKWAVRPPHGTWIPEIIDRNAWSRGLTMPIPPLLIRDYREFSKHPLIAWSWDAKSLMPSPPPQMGDSSEEDDDSDGTFLPGSGGGLPSSPGMPSGGGMGGMMGGMGGMMGEGGGMGGYGGYGGEGGEGGYGGDGMMGGMGGMGGMMGGMGGMMGGMGGMMGGYGGAAGEKTPQPEYKMVRCYDMLPVKASEIGKVYRYRIRLLMRDPNYPEDLLIPQPAPNELKDEVWARVAPIQRKDDAAIKADDKAIRTLRKTEWSQASPPVMVKAPYEVFAGNVEFDGPRNFVQGQTPVELTVKEPQGNVMVTGLDFRTGATYTFEEEVRRGTVLSKKFDAEVIAPVSKEIKLSKDYTLVSGAAVADIRGGQKLAGDSRDDPLEAAGEFMILNMRDGRVEVASELDDMFIFRMYSFADEEETPSSATGGAGGLGGGMGGMGGMGGPAGGY